MDRRVRFWAVIAFSLLAQALSAPIPDQRFQRATEDLDNTIDIEDIAINDSTSSTTSTRDPFDDDDDDEDFGPEPSTGGGGSNIFSLLRIVSALFPGSSSSNIVRNILKKIRQRQAILVPENRKFIDNNEIDSNDNSVAKTEFQRQEIDEIEPDVENNGEESEEGGGEEGSEENGSNDERDDTQEENSNLESTEDNDSDFDSDEPPGGDDEGGGGILGLLAGLSGGEDGQSDLGSLLATVSGIIANLSGDGIDLNSLIASGIGLFVGLLSEGEENPGTVIASYLLTSLDTLSGGGAKNNGQFFGKFLSKLIKGTSAAGDPDESIEGDGNTMPMADSAGFFASFLMSLLGDMSKSSSGGSSHPW